MQLPGGWGLLTSPAREAPSNARRFSGSKRKSCESVVTGTQHKLAATLCVRGVCVGLFHLLEVPPGIVAFMVHVCQFKKKMLLKIF